MKNKSVYLMVLFLLIWSANANSACWEISITEVASISPNPSSEFGRLLFKFDLPDLLDGVVIDYAEMIFTATPDTGSGYVCLMGAFPVTRRWEAAGLSWFDRWTNSGGDYADTIYSTCAIGGSENSVTRIDITDIVQMWVDGTLTNYGLILMPIEDSNRFLKLHDTPDLAPGAKAKVRIYYTPPEADD